MLCCRVFVDEFLPPGSKAPAAKEQLLTGSREVKVFKQGLGFRV